MKVLKNGFLLESRIKHQETKKNCVMNKEEEENDDKEDLV
jgi:hypothetical protein